MSYLVFRPYEVVSCWDGVFVFDCCVSSSFSWSLVFNWRLERSLLQMIAMVDLSDLSDCQMAVVLVPSAEGTGLDLLHYMVVAILFLGLMMLQALRRCLLMCLGWGWPPAMR